MSKKHALAGIIGESQRQVMDSVVDEITAKPQEEYLLQLMPPRNIPASTLIIQKVSGFGGMTQERGFGEKGKPVHGSTRRTFYWEPGSYQEHIPFYEKELLMLAKLGTLGDRGITGLTSGELDEMQRAGQNLQLRLKNRLNYLAADALFNGRFVWNGVTNDFGIPTANKLVAASDWTNYATSTPLQDLYTLQTTSVLLMKYTIKEFVINPKTAADMLNSQEVRGVLKNYNLMKNDLNIVGQFLFPGLAPIKVVKDAWQDQSFVNGAIVNGNAQFFVPSNKVLVVPEFGGTLYGQYGELQICENLNAPGASIASPAQGIYTFVSEKGLEDSESPHVKVISGFNGGANLKRSDDTITIGTNGSP